MILKPISFGTFFQVNSILDDGEEFVLSYMEEGTKGSFKWPTKADMSTEPRSHIIKTLSAPVLVEDISSTRVQYFKFTDIEQ